MAAMGLLTAEFVEAAKHVTPQVVLSPVLRPGLNLHAPHVDFHDVVLVLAFDDDRQGSRRTALNPKMLDLSSAHAGSIGFARRAGKIVLCGGGPRAKKKAEKQRRSQREDKDANHLSVKRLALPRKTISNIFEDKNRRIDASQGMRPAKGRECE